MLNEQALAGLMSNALPVPLDAAHRSAFQQRFNQLPAMLHMGAQLDLDHDHLVRAHIPKLEAHHRGGMGTDAVNGAVLASLADCVIGVAGVMQFDGKRAGTVELDMKFLRAARGSQVTSCAVAIKKSRSVVFVSAEVYCDGVLCAQGSGLVARSGRDEDQF